MENFDKLVVEGRGEPRPSLEKGGGSLGGDCAVCVRRYGRGRRRRRRRRRRYGRGRRRRESSHDPVLSSGLDIHPVMQWVPTLPKRVSEVDMNEAELGSH